MERIRRAARRPPRLVQEWAAYGLLVDAELLWAEGRCDPDRWAEVVAAFERLERPFRLAQARHRWAEALLDAGRASSPSRQVRDRAAEPLAQAYDTALRLGAVPLRESIEHLAGRARVPLPAPRDGAGAGSGEGARDGTGGGAVALAPPADPVESFGLTRRERDVLRLVAAGRSNRQIAQELYISPKTASVHVSNILAKLEVSGRGEAAAMAHRLRLVEPVDGDGYVAGSAAVG